MINNKQVLANKNYFYECHNIDEYNQLKNDDLKREIFGGLLIVIIGLIVWFSVITKCIYGFKR